MRKRKKPEVKSKQAEPIAKIANLLALLLVKYINQGDAIMQLSRSGFSDDEIGDLLNTTLGTIRQTRYAANKKKKKKKKKRKPT